MTLQQAETKLSELNAKIAQLFEEREVVLKEWNTAFLAENQDGITCIDENIGDSHNLYLINGELKMHVCHLDTYDIKVSMHILNIANGRDFEIPDCQRNLVYAKAIEIRDSLKDTDDM